MDLKLTNEWISPEGKEYELPKNETHKIFIKKNFNITQDEALNQGWIRVAYINIRNITLAIHCKNKNKCYQINHPNNL